MNTMIDEKCRAVRHRNCRIVSIPRELDGTDAPRARTAVRLSPFLPAKKFGSFGRTFCVKKAKIAKRTQFSMQTIINK